MYELHSKLNIAEIISYLDYIYEEILQRLYNNIENQCWRVCVRRESWNEDSLSLFQKDDF